MLGQNKPKEFQQLKSEWYEKLKKDGFEEIEDTNSSKEFLKTWHSSWFKVRKADYLTKQEYYYQAAQFLTRHQFVSKTEEEIWKLHSEGKSFRDIAKKIREMGVRSNKDNVNKIVNVLRKKMSE